RDRQRRDLLAQRFFRPRDFLLDLGLGGGHQAIAFYLGGALGIVDDLRPALIGLGDGLLHLLARLAHHLVGALRRVLEVLLAAFARGEPVGDRLLALLDRAQHVRPDQLDREPDEGREDDGLREQRQVDVHAFPPARARSVTNPVARAAGCRWRTRARGRRR